MRVIARLALSLASTLLITAGVLEAQQNPGPASNARTTPAPSAQGAPKGDVENG
jgi:hypothetical protein